jgi:hypothetical protein
MPELSPAAQAILDASTSVFWRPLIDVPAFQNKSIAAALQAAANQLAYGHTDHPIIDEKALLAIAAELEA